jgi:hypothetical protein
MPKPPSVGTIHLTVVILRKHFNYLIFFVNFIIVFFLSKCYWFCTFVFCWLGFIVSLTFEFIFVSLFGVQFIFQVKDFFHYLSKNLKILPILSFITVLHVVLLQPAVERNSSQIDLQDLEVVDIAGVVLKCNSNKIVLKW